MQDVFDPYHKWLGIPPQEQPPHHYRLLALPLFESDPEVIESAADQRMGHVRTFQSGRYSALSQQILNELAAARVCLLSHEKKTIYDAELQSQLAPEPPQAPPRQTPASILPSPPPPVLGPPPQASSQQPLPADPGIAPPPAEGMLSQPAPLFPPLDGALPDPTPPALATSTKPRPSNSLSLVASALGITLLLFAAVAFWLLYRGQTVQDAAASNQTPSVSDPLPIPEPDEPLPMRTDEEATEDTNSDPMEPAAEDQAPSEDPEVGDAAAPEPVEPPIDPGPALADLLKEAGEAETSTAPSPSLADVLKQADESSQQAAEDTESPQITEEEPAEVEEKGPEKWRVPRPASFNRVASKLRPLPNDFNRLLVEAQKPERPGPEVYVLLMAAGNKAVADLNADGALQAIDLIESKFDGNFDKRRVESLHAIFLLLSKQRSSRALRSLADVALRASQEAQQSENKPLATGLGTVALEAAVQAGDTAMQERIKTHLGQL